MNLPLTSSEYVLPVDEVIITHTDPDSRITYANPEFLRSSGYSLDEVLGEPQNIVRHPDMPREVFADLWATIRCGKPWTGVIKNRRKDGGFYWVRANVTPIMQNGAIKGYMSVRVRPQAQEIQQAIALYSRIRTGDAGGVRIVEGRAVPTGLVGLIRQACDLRLSTGTALFVGLLGLLFMGIAVTTLTVDALSSAALTAIGWSHSPVR